MKPIQERQLPTHSHFRFSIRRALTRSRRSTSKSRQDVAEEPSTACAIDRCDGIEMGWTPVQCILVNDVMVADLLARPLGYADNSILGRRLLKEPVKFVTKYRDGGTLG